jgi:hypothetical protein
VPDIGIHWTLDTNKAWPYGGKGDRKYYYVYYSTVKLSDIDLLKTLKALTGDFPAEKEIVLKRGKRIKINRVDRIELLEPVRIDNKWTFPRNTVTFNTKYYVNT